MQEEGVTLVNVLIVSKWQMRYSIFTFFHCKVNTLYVLPHDIDCHTFVNTLVNNTGVKDQEWTVLLNNFPSSVFTTIIKDFTFINWSCRVYSVTIGCYPSECWLWKTTSVTCECHVFFNASFSWWINVVDWRWGLKKEVEMLKGPCHASWAILLCHF